MNATADIVPFPVAAFLIEFDSERMHDALIALTEAGFVCVHVKGTTNRFRVSDDRNFNEVTLCQP